MAARPKKTTPAEKSAEPRQLKKPRHGRRIKRHLKVTRTPLPKAKRLFRQSVAHLFRHWRVFFGIVIIYLILTIVLVKGFGVSNNISGLKSALDEGSQGGAATVTT